MGAGEITEVVVCGPEFAVADDVKAALCSASGDVDQVGSLRPVGRCSGFVRVAAEDKDDDGRFAALCGVGGAGAEARACGDAAV